MVFGGSDCLHSAQLTLKRIAVGALVGCHWTRCQRRPGASGGPVASNAAMAGLHFELVCCYFATAIVYLFFMTLKYYLFLIRN